MFNPYYVGVSRSGCHWLRINLEGYMDGHSPLSNHLGCIEEPIQKMYERVERGEFKGTHDMDLKFETNHVVYLYRNPIDCIFSNLKYDGADINNRNEVSRYLQIWIAHINKWLWNEKFTEKKVIICYEYLMNDFVKEFSKLVLFMGLDVNEEKILKHKAEFTKEKIKDIVHDKKVINLENNYELHRAEFIRLHGNFIVNSLPMNQFNLWQKHELPTLVAAVWQKE